MSVSAFCHQIHFRSPWTNILPLQSRWSHGWFHFSFEQGNDLPPSYFWKCTVKNRSCLSDSFPRPRNWATNFSSRLSQINRSFWHRRFRSRYNIGLALSRWSVGPIARIRQKWTRNGHHSFSSALCSSSKASWETSRTCFVDWRQLDPFLSL